MKVQLHVSAFNVHKELVFPYLSVPLVVGLIVHPQAVLLSGQKELFFGSLSILSALLILCGHACTCAWNFPGFLSQ